MSQRSPPHLESPLHPFKAEYWVLLEMWKEQGPEQQLEEKWKEPYDILFTTHASLKLYGVKPWVHHTKVKRLSETDQPSLPTASEQIPKKWTSHLLGNLKYLFWQVK